MKQFVLTTSASKRLIAKALSAGADIQEVLQSGTLVIIAGTTNGYVAEEILAKLGQAEEFSKKRFFRGVILPPNRPVTEAGTLADQSGFPGDVVITKGVWRKGKTIFDVVDELRQGDVILKGLNAVDLKTRKGGILIGHPQGGTILAALKAVVGRRVRLVLPVGLEKRVEGDLDALALKVNHPAAQGPRLLTVTGEVFTELDALAYLTGVKADLIGGGGVCGAEGSIRLALSGDADRVAAAQALLKEIASEPPFEI